ncbi:MAG: alanine:cation symporter family protein, partial [Shewanella sp.]
AVALFFFAFTTIVAYYYIAETNIAYINRKANRPWLTVVLKVVLMASTVYGTVKTADLAWGMGDIGVGLMAWLNIIAIILLQRIAFTCLKDYESQQKQGVEPLFDPEKLGIPHADYWVERKNAQDELAQSQSSETPKIS